LIPTSDHPVLQSITGWGNPFSGAVIFSTICDCAYR
jgi:hypothetical protein